MSAVKYLLLGVALLLVSGCGSSSGPIPNDETEKVRDAIIDVADASRDEAEFKKFFIGEPPADRTKYQGIMFYTLRDWVTMSGDTATATVKMKTNDSAEKDLGEMTWTVQRDENGVWKLKDAPLPQ